jgi:hypothetical protein
MVSVCMSVGTPNAVDILQLHPYYIDVAVCTSKATEVVAERVVCAAPGGCALFSLQLTYIETNAVILNPRFDAKPDSCFQHLNTVAPHRV